MQPKDADATSETNLLGALVQKLVAGIDDGLLGVKVHTESVKLEPLSGAVEVQGLQVDNPHGFRSKYLLRADKVAVRVNMARLIGSLGGTVEVDEVNLDQVDVIYEKSLTTSNLNTLLQKIGEGGEASSGSEQPPKQASQSSQQASHASSNSNASASDVNVVLHRVAVRNVGAKVCTSLSTMAGPRLAVGDMQYEDFEKSSGGAKGLMQVVKLVVATLIRSILASILGKSAENGVARAASGVRSSITNVLHRSRDALSSRKAEAGDAQHPSTVAWCGCNTAPWRCCQDGLGHEEGELMLR